MPGKIRFVVAGLLLTLLAALWVLRPSLPERFVVQAPKLAGELFAELDGQLRDADSEPRAVRLLLELPASIGAPTRSACEEALSSQTQSKEDGQLVSKLRVAAPEDGAATELTLRWNGTSQDLALEGIDATRTRHLSDYRSLLPPFLTIVLAVLIAKTIPALLAGVLLGCFLLQGVFGGLALFAKGYVWERVLTDDFRLEILGFVVFLVITVGILTRAGGIEGLVLVIKKVARSARSSQLATWLMGFVIFFDDYANTIVVGSTMRPLTDRMRVSREKLAYIVDSTAAPIAGIALLSTWIAYEISTFSAQLPDVGLQEGQGYQIFLATLPYRFYCIFTLFFVFATIVLRREFGPMLRAEQRARRTGKLMRDGAIPMVSAEATSATAKEGAPARWINGLLPIATMIGVTLVFLWRSGAGEKAFAFDFVLWRDVLSNADSAKAILYGSMSAAGLAALLALTQRILTPMEVLHAAWKSVRGIGFAMLILVLAWCIGYVCEDMGTAYYLVAQTQGSLPPLLLPVLLFLLSCLVAFATGSSWSTMAILLPIVVILAHTLGSTLPIGGYMLMVLSIGAVLEGSIFGDHCSPISDTTVLSSVASASDHLDHVQTQIPYAMLAMIVSIVLGYLPVAFFSPSLWPLSLGLGMLTIVLFLLFVGRDPDAPAAD